MSELFSGDVIGRGAFECKSCGMPTTDHEMQQRTFRSGACGYCGGMMEQVTAPTLRAAIEALRDEHLDHYSMINAALLKEMLTAALAKPDAGEERVAQLRAHRACLNEEHDPANGKISGFCVVCGIPWPCAVAKPADTPPPSPQPSLTREVCICAAIKLPDGRVINGHRHHNCFAAIAELASVDPSIPSRSKRFEQGFTTSHRRFVNREEGLALQLAAGIPSADPVRKGYGNQLFSEDLY